MKNHTTLSLLIVAAGLFYAEIRTGEFDIDEKVHTSLVQTQQVKETQETHDSEQAHILRDQLDSNTVINIEGVQNIILDYLKNNPNHALQHTLIGYDTSKIIHQGDRIPSFDLKNFDFPTAFNAYFSHNKQLIAISTFHDPNIILLNLRTNKIQWFPSIGVESLDFSSDGQYLACGAHKGNIIIINLKNNNQIIHPTESRYPLRYIQFSQDCTCLIVAAGNLIFIHAFEKAQKPKITQKKLLQCTTEHGIRELQLNSTGTLLAANTWDSLLLWHNPLCASENDVPTRHSSNRGFLSLRFSPNGECLAVGSINRIFLYDTKKQNLTYKQQITLPQDDQTLKFNAISLRFLSHNHLAAIIRQEPIPQQRLETISSKIHIWDIGKAPVDQLINTIPTYHQRFCASRDGEHIISVGEGAKIRTFKNQERYDIIPTIAPPWWKRLASKFSKKNMLRAMQYAGGAIGLGSLYMARKQPQHAQSYHGAAALGFGATALSMLLQKYYKQPRPARARDVEAGFLSN